MHLKNECTFEKTNTFINNSSKCMFPMSKTRKKEEINTEIKKLTRNIAFSDVIILQLNNFKRVTDLLHDELEK